MRLRLMYTIYSACSTIHDCEAAQEARVHGLQRCAQQLHVAAFTHVLVYTAHRGWMPRAACHSIAAERRL